MPSWLRRLSFRLTYFQFVPLHRVHYVLADDTPVRVKSSCICLLDVPAMIVGIETTNPIKETRHTVGPVRLSNQEVRTYITHSFIILPRDSP